MIGKNAVVGGGGNGTSGCCGTCYDVAGELRLRLTFLDDVLPPLVTSSAAFL